MSSPITEALEGRRAIRKYLPQPVPVELVREILAEARWAPSATNTQSTYVYVLSGPPFEQFKAELRTYAESEVPEAPTSSMRDMPPELKARQEDLFRTRMSFIAAEEAKPGIQPQDPQSPLVAGAAIFEPATPGLGHAKIIGIPYGCFDAGMLAQSIALAAHVRGLGTCITGSNVRYAELLRKVLPGTEDKSFIVAIALGYPEWEAPINRFPRTRIPVDEFVTFVR